MGNSDEPLAAPEHVVKIQAFRMGLIPDSRNFGQTFKSQKGVTGFNLFTDYHLREEADLFRYQRAQLYVVPDNYDSGDRVGQKKPGSLLRIRYQIFPGVKKYISAHSVITSRKFV